VRPLLPRLAQKKEPLGRYSAYLHVGRSELIARAIGNDLSTPSVPTPEEFASPDTFPFVRMAIARTGFNGIVQWRAARSSRAAHGAQTCQRWCRSSSL
jgi:hypothetical protein